MWKDLSWSPMRRCTVGYGKTNARKVLCTNTFDEKERSTTNVEIPLQEEKREFKTFFFLFLRK